MCCSDNYFWSNLLEAVCAFYTWMSIPSSKLCEFSAPMILAFISCMDFFLIHTFASLCFLGHHALILFNWGRDLLIFLSSQSNIEPLLYSFGWTYRLCCSCFLFWTHPVKHLLIPPLKVLFFEMCLYDLMESWLFRLTPGPAVYSTEIDWMATLGQCIPPS